MGVWSGVSGVVVIDGPKAAHPSTVERTVVTTFSGVNGPLIGAGLDCGENGAVTSVTTVLGDAFETATAAKV
ncbi:MAG: hypothetical protein NVSMB60_19280 [Mycobacterium sp.]